MEASGDSRHHSFSTFLVDQLFAFDKLCRFYCPATMPLLPLLPLLPLQLMTLLPMLLPLLQPSSHFYRKGE